MNDDTSKKKPTLSRREVLRGAGIVVGTGLVPRLSLGVGQDAFPVILSASEYNMLDAICRRLIPSDENGPGAGEAMAARFIDRALAGALAGSRDQYAAGLAAIDDHARTSKGASFVDLGEAEQDAVLTEVQDGVADGIPPGFFNTVRSHTIQGTFSDPFYGGNAEFVGWDMIGYPGVRVSVAAEFQQMDIAHPPNHVSVYDSTMFEPGED